MTHTDRETIQTAALDTLRAIAAYPSTLDWRVASFSAAAADMARMARDALEKEDAR